LVVDKNENILRNPLDGLYPAVEDPSEDVSSPAELYRRMPSLHNGAGDEQSPPEDIFAGDLLLVAFLTTLIPPTGLVAGPFADFRS
jgi:hypothetical protein